jgi:hypothetical protein
VVPIAGEGVNDGDDDGPETSYLKVIRSSIRDGVLEKFLEEVLER